MIIVILNAILMLFQVAGAGNWSQFMATEEIVNQMPTLFVSSQYQVISLTQVRPSGFLHSNNYLSLIILFAMAMHFSRNKSIYRWEVAVLSFIMVLAMARIVFVGYLIFGIIILIVGKGNQRKSYYKSALFTLMFFCLYYIFFPGLFSNMMSMDRLLYSTYIRLNDIADHLILAGYGDRLYNILQGTPTAEWKGSSAISGYSKLINNKYIIACVIIVITGVLIKLPGLINKLSSPTAMLTLLSLVVIIIYPAAVPFFQAQIYWWIFSISVYPLLNKNSRNVVRI